MKKLGTVIHTNDWGYNVCVVYLREIGSKKMSFQIYVEAPEGTMSDIVTVKMSDFYSKPSALKFLLDMEGDFSFNDVKSVKENIRAQQYNVIDIEEKLPIEEIHLEISRYIKDNAEKLIENAESDIFIQNDYGYVQVNRFEADLKTNEVLKAMGYKKLDILKRLKILGALQTGKNRPYDYTIRVDGQLKRYYKILLADETNIEDEEDEVIDCVRYEVLPMVRG